MADRRGEPRLATGTAGIVVIGRNEGDRLSACLASLPRGVNPVVYVDSGSHDASAARARESGVDVVELDPSRAFSAARARNEGFTRVRAQHPAVDFVQFIDADCTLAQGWLVAAAAAFAGADERVAIVTGMLVERRPEASVYNRLCSLEWKSPAGDLTDCGALGGIMMVSCTAFERLGGFNENVIAGEDSELGVRACLAGLRVRKIDDPMATHDADIHRFGQWWRRAVRSGHATAQRFALNGGNASKDGSRQIRSIMAWGALLPLLVLATVVPTRGAALLLLLGYPLLVFRIARFRKARGDTLGDAWLYARYTALAKFAEALGVLRFLLARLRGRYRIIEYK